MNNLKKKLVGRPAHVCNERKEAFLTCVDEYGRLMNWIDVVQAL